MEGMLIKMGDGEQHVCEPPHYMDHRWPAGTVWECTKCGKQWKLKVKDFRNWKWVKTWRKRARKGEGA